MKWRLLEREFDELKEKPKSQNENGNRKRNQKDLSLFANCPKKIRMRIFNQRPLVFI